MKSRISSLVQTAHHFLFYRIGQSHNVLDATAGNGHDTLFLASHSPLSAKVWFCDIQKQALEKTTKLLEEAGLADKGVPIHACHSAIDQYIKEPLDVAMFNLGYLPGGSHSLTTQKATTLTALEKVLSLLVRGGLVSVIAYPGHFEGNLEHETVRNYVMSLSSAHFMVARWELVNQKNNPPVLYIVEKK
ncbi:MAG: rRNA methylase [Firmicutes bacterium]|nr:rRNA methylase [Bacillota bacterium]